ncbi:MAG: GntR family transcriptional regulator [Beijerinckiaceae bacterium]
MSSKTQRLYLLLKERIVSGAFAEGERLPGEPQLAQTHNLSRVTVRRALDGLARDGLIRRHPGSGTFVRSDGAAKPLTGDLTDMLAHLRAMGRDTDVSLLSAGYADPPAAVAEALRLEPDGRTLHAVRVRSMDGEPFSHLTTHVPERIGRRFSEADLASTPLLTLLERSGVVADRAEQTITATLAGPEVAAALEVGIGSPLISLVRVVFDRDGQGVEHLSALYRPDRHRFSMELTRAGEGADRYWQNARPAFASRREAAPRRRKP